VEVWFRADALVSINVHALRRPRLASRRIWPDDSPTDEWTVLLSNHHPTQPGHPSVVWLTEYERMLRIRHIRGVAVQPTVWLTETGLAYVTREWANVLPNSVCWCRCLSSKRLFGQ